ncbi:hypothetical protein [Clostridium sp.]|nr:hypothetical protein [Clostridium sp.]
MNKEIIKKIIKIEKLKYEIINEPLQKDEEEIVKEVKKVKVNFL